MRMIVWATLAATAVFAVPAQAKSCACKPGACVKLETGTSIEGVVTIRKDAFMLKLDRATCFKGNGDDDDIVAGEDRPGVRFVQIAPAEGDEAKLKGLVGKRVTLKGDAFGKHTRYHSADALFSPKEILAAE